MTGSDLRTLLRDHTQDAPAMTTPAADIMAAGRRRHRRRTTGLAAGAVGVLALAGATVPLLVSDEPDAVEAAAAPGAADLGVVATLESVAEDNFTPYVDLGEPTVDVETVQAEDVPEGDEDAQMFDVEYAPSSDRFVSVGASGVAQVERMIFETACGEEPPVPGEDLPDMPGTCRDITLPDGSVARLVVMPVTHVDGLTYRAPTSAELPDVPAEDLYYLRAVDKLTDNDVLLFAGEFVKAATPAAAEEAWAVPTSALKDAVADPGLDDLEMAHDSYPYIVQP